MDYLMTGMRGQRIILVHHDLLVAFFRGHIRQCESDAPADIRILGAASRPKELCGAVGHGSRNQFDDYVAVLCDSAKWDYQFPVPFFKPTFSTSTSLV